MSAHILVPLDGSAFSEEALPAAVGLAKRTESAIELVLVQEPLVIPEFLQRNLMGGARLDEEMHDAGELYLSLIAGRLHEAGVDVVETVLQGPVVTVLAEYIAGREPQLVVMSTHGRGGISRAWIGSVADALVRRASAPVLLVRPRGDIVHRQGAPALEVLPGFNRIAVPLDGSALAEEALDTVLGSFRTEGLELTLLQVLPPPVTYLSASFTPSVSAELLADLETDAQRYLDRVARRIGRPGLTVRTRVFVDANAARGILAFASGGSVDLIAMTTHARGGLARLVVGSVADKVVRGAVVPVLLMRPHALQSETSEDQQAEELAAAARE